MLDNVRALGVLIASAVLSIALPGVARSQESSAITEKLARSRVLYENQMETLRSQVSRSLSGDLAAAAKGDGGDFQLVKDRIEAFESRGEIPEIPQGERWEATYAKLAQAMLGAYRSAIAECESISDDARESAITEEMESFETHWDLGPWRHLLTDGTRTVSPGSSLELEVDGQGEYRLDVRGRRIDDAGSLRLEFPLENGDHLAVDATPDDAGQFRVLLTIREGRVFAELGVPRPLDISTATPATSAALRFSAVGSAVEVSSVMVKRVVSGEIPEIKKPDPRRNLGTQKPNAVEPEHWWAGRKWVGSEGHGTATATVLRRDGDSIVIKISRHDGAVMELVGQVRGNAMTVNDVSQNSGPRGLPPPYCKDGRGSGRIDASGKLRLSYTFRWSNPHRKNVLWNGTFQGE